MIGARRGKKRNEREKKEKEKRKKPRFCAICVFFFFEGFYSFFFFGFVSHHPQHLRLNGSLERIFFPPPSTSASGINQRLSSNLLRDGAASPLPDRLLLAALLSFISQFCPGTARLPGSIFTIYYYYYHYYLLLLLQEVRGKKGTKRGSPLLKGREGISFLFFSCFFSLF